MPCTRSASPLFSRSLRSVRVRRQSVGQTIDSRIGGASWLRPIPAPIATGLRTAIPPQPANPRPLHPSSPGEYLRPLTHHSSRPCFARRLNSGVRAHAKRHSERIQSPYSGSVPRCCAWRHLARHRVLWWLRLARTGNVRGACNRVTVTCSVRTKSQPITSASLSFGYCCCMHVLPSPRPFRSLLPNPPWARRLLPSGGYGAALRAVLNGP